MEEIQGYFDEVKEKYADGSISRGLSIMATIGLSVMAQSELDENPENLKGVLKLGAEIVEFTETLEKCDD